MIHDSEAWRNALTDTLRRLYDEARYDDFLIGLGCGAKDIAHNRELWHLVEDYCAAHGITADEYAAAIVEPEAKVIEDAQKVVQHLEYDPDPESYVKSVLGSPPMWKPAPEPPDAEPPVGPDTPPLRSAPKGVRNTWLG